MAEATLVVYHHLADVADRLPGGGLDRCPLINDGRTGRDVLFSNQWWVGPPEEISDDEWAKLTTANSAAPLAIIRETFRRIQGPGSLTMLTHVWSMGTSPEMGAAGASKASLGPLIKAAAYRGAGRSVRVNGIALGVVDSPFFHGLMADRAPAAGFDARDAFDRVVERTAVGFSHGLFPPC